MKENEEFELLRVKLTPTGGLDVTYKLTVTEEDGTIFVQKQHTAQPYKVHADLYDAMQATKTYVADMFGMERANNMKIKSYSFSGKTMSGVVIGAVYEIEDKKKATMQTPRIKFGEETEYCYEEEIGQICETICEEVKKYLFEDKREEMQVFGE